MTTGGEIFQESCRLGCESAVTWFISGFRNGLLGVQATRKENGHAKTNGNASPTADGAAEEVQANGKHSADGEVKAEDGAAEKATEEGAAESAPVANGEDASKPEDDGSASGSGEATKQKKRFSFKKPFKLSGFSFKKSAKKEAETEEAAGPAEEGKDEAESEEAKPEASGGEEKGEAADGAKADQPSTDDEQKPETPAEEKPAEASAEEPAPAPAAESPDAQPAAAEE